MPWNLSRRVQTSIARALRNSNSQAVANFGKILDFFVGDHATHTQQMFAAHCADDSVLKRDTAMHRHIPFITKIGESVCVCLAHPPAMPLVDRASREVPLVASPEQDGGDPGINVSVESWNEIVDSTNLMGSLAWLEVVGHLGRTAFLYLRRKGDSIHFEALHRGQVRVDPHPQFPADLSLAQAVLVANAGDDGVPTTVPRTWTAWTRTELADGQIEWGCFQVNRGGGVLTSDPIWGDGVNGYGMHPLALWTEWEPQASMFLPLDLGLIQTQLVENKNRTVIDEAMEHSSTGQKVLSGVNVGLGGKIKLGNRYVLAEEGGTKFRIEKADANLAGMLAVQRESTAAEIGMRGLPVSILSTTEPSNNTGAAQSQRMVHLTDKRRRRIPQVLRNLLQVYPIVRGVWNIVNPDRAIDESYRLRPALAYSAETDPASQQAEAQSLEILVRLGVIGAWQAWLVRHRGMTLAETAVVPEAVRGEATREVARNVGLYRKLSGEADKPASQPPPAPTGGE